MTGRIFEIQRFSIHDGPGIRTTVFLKGCPLRCSWCHNPESISPDPQLSFLPEKCIGCGYCYRVCPNGAQQMAGGRRFLDRTRCIACGRCTSECYAGALELVGKETTVDKVLTEVLRDAPFYETSAGGMTLSGGEPTLQIEFSTALLAGAKAQGLHCAVETCLFCSYEALERIRPHVDLFLCDWKETDPQKHRQYTGAGNEQIRTNLLGLDQAGSLIRLRCPIIPGLNDRDDHFAGIASLAKELTHLDGVEFMPYHRLGESKLERFGMVVPRTASAAPAEETICAWKDDLKARGISVL